MKLSELKKLAEKVQLTINSEEANYLLTSFSELEKILAKFRELQLEDKQFLKQRGITLGKLYQLSKQYSMHTTKQATFHHNAMVSEKNFLFIRKSPAAST